MKRALFMTIGTGVGGEDAVHKLAHGLLTSIIHYKPDLTLFFGSDISLNTVESIKNQYRDRFEEEMDDCQFIKINDVDRFEECFQKIRQEIKKLPDYDIIIDYTSGTKTMTMSAAIASVLYHKELTLVSGERGKNGLVSTYTEEIKTQSLYSAYDKLLMDKMKDAFNHHRFETALGILDEMVHLENREAYKKLVEAYLKWDRFNHDEAMELLNHEDIQKLNNPSLKVNKSFLGTLVNARDIKELYLLTDLINNAHRRSQEGKYDDALARLYRSVELIAQTKLKKYEIDTSDVDIEKIPIFAKKEFKESQDRNGKIKIGLHPSYKLLRYLDDDLGKTFTNDKRLKDLLKKRNDSILAHGMTPIAQKNYNELYDKTLELARILTTQIDDLMKKAEFPRL